jgi:hypothetical protein
MIRDAASTAPPAPVQRPARVEAARAEAGEALRPAPQAPQINPKLRVDPGLNMVVIEFRGSDGEVERSIPSPREIKAYRTAGLEPEGKAQSLDLTG